MNYIEINSGFSFESFCFCRILYCGDCPCRGEIDYTEYDNGVWINNICEQYPGDSLERYEYELY